MALDGLAAYLETIRNLVISSIDDEPVPAFAETKSKSQMIMGMIPDKECIHENVIKIETLGGIQELCNDCGLQL
jgi:hypothetical protein